MYLLRGFWPVAYDAQMVTVVLVLAFGLSCVSYYFVEKPILALRHKLRAGLKTTAAPSQGSGAIEST
jgi:peptidoglycan/LPS O-acetylase OafA/YrhL